MTRTCYFVLLALFFIVPNHVFSQHRLEGTLKSEDNEPVAFANVILLSAEDSVKVYKGAVSNEEGQFVFYNVEEDEYVLKASFVGFEEHLQKILVPKENHLEIFLEEAPDFLDEVTVNARKPNITRGIDRITFDVENSTLSTGSTWDILRKTPGVVLNQGQLQVRNGAVAVYINDRKVQLSQAELESLLQSYSAENIKSVEVITNPPARYEAEGGAILNISTTKVLTPGYKGSLEGAFTQGVFPKYRLGTSHYFKTDDFNFFANYSFNPRKELKRDDSYINFMDDQGDVFSRWNTDFERVTRSQAHNANFILDYNFDDKNSLSFSSNLNFSPNKTFNNRVYTEIADAQNHLDSTLVTRSGLENDENNLGFDLDYTHRFENGGEFSSAVHYTLFNQQRGQHVASNYFSPQEDLLNTISFRTDAHQEINIFTGQIDYTTSIGHAGFETGAKVSAIDSESGIDFFNAESLSELYDYLSDEFLYDEKVYAAYASVSRDWEKWSAKAGLRGEYTDLEGHSVSLNEINTQIYFQLFPTAYLQYRASEAHSFALDYSRRIERPKYQSLNPFRYFLNENNYNAGNPNLRAAISNNFNLNYTLNNQYFFDLYYRDYGKSPATLGFQDNQNLSIRNVSMNLLNSKSYGIDLLHGRSLTGWWYAQAYVSVFHDENTFLALESDNAEVTNEVDAFFGQLHNSFTLSKDGTFSGTMSFTYVSDYISGSYNFDPMATLSAGFRKTLWNNRAEVTLNIEDILNKTNTRLTSRYLNQDNSFFAREEMRYVQVGFKYNFGNFRLEDNQREIEAAERERL